MKYIIGASIGGLFGLSVPMFMNAHDAGTTTELISPRLEDSQQSERDDVEPGVADDEVYLLPSPTCPGIKLDPNSPKEQAKECLRQNTIKIIPAI